MMNIMFILSFCLILGLAAIASNPSPYFAALCLVAVAGIGCGVLINCGSSFLPLILFLIYLGGMLVVFAYSAALAAEPHPEGWGTWPMLSLIMCYLLCVTIFGFLLCKDWFNHSWLVVTNEDNFFGFRSDMGGIAMMYSSGGNLLLLGAWALLLTLFVVLALTHGLSYGTLRAL